DAAEVGSVGARLQELASSLWARLTLGLLGLGGAVIMFQRKKPSEKNQQINDLVRETRNTRKELNTRKEIEGSFGPSACFGFYGVMGHGSCKVAQIGGAFGARRRTKALKRPRISKTI